MTGAADLRHARIGIAGLGLIGGSLALALRRTLPHAAIVGVDRPEILDAARALGAIDQARTHVGELADADVVVLATPLSEMPALLLSVAGAGLRAVITDVGSTKRHVLDAAAQAGLTRFIGGHPMAGAETGGLAHARADLFDHRPWLVTSGYANGTGASHPPAEQDLAIVEALARAAGAVPRRIDAELHDRLVAYVSHVPQLMAVALMSTVGERAGTAGLEVSGRGLADMTRLASSPANIWQDILATNADFVDEALHAVRAQWPAGESVANRDWVRRAFEDAAAWRARLLALQRPIH
jgi:prephenate dehydrogenase